MMKNVHITMRNYPKKKEKKHTFIHLYISELPHFNGKKKLIINKMTLTTLYLALIVSFTCWTLRKNIRCSIHMLRLVNHMVSYRNSHITLTPNNFLGSAHVSNTAGVLV